MMTTHNEPMTAKRPVHNARPASERLGSEARVVGKDLQELSGSALEAVQDKFGELKETASEYLEIGKDKIKEAEKTVEEFIQEQPIKAVLIAAAAGWVLGRYCMRR